MHNINKELTVTIVSFTQQPIIGSKETSIVYRLRPKKCPLNKQTACICVQVGSFLSSSSLQIFSANAQNLVTIQIKAIEQYVSMVFVIHVHDVLGQIAILSATK